MSDFTLLNSRSRMALKLIKTDSGPVIATAPVRHDRLISEFLSRWNVELKQTIRSNIPAQFTIAYALAGASHGDPHYQYYHPNLGNQLKHLRIPNKYWEHENPREIYVRIGIFDMPLPQIRMLTNRVDLSISDAQEPAVSFKAFIACATHLLKSAQKQNQDISPYLLALLVHGTQFNYSIDNEFRITQRGDFLQEFIAYYNSFTLIHNKGDNHEQK